LVVGDLSAVRALIPSKTADDCDRASAKLTVSQERYQDWSKLKMLCQIEVRGLTEAGEQDEIDEGGKRVEHGCGVDGYGDEDANTWL
jgi:hypothetical protein